MAHGTTWGRRADESGRCICGATPGLDADGGMKPHRDPEGNACLEAVDTTERPRGVAQSKDVCTFCGLWFCSCAEQVDKFERFISRGRP